MRIYDEEDSDQDSELFQAVPSIEKQQITMHSSSKLNKRTSVRAKNTVNGNDSLRNALLGCTFKRS